MLTFYWKGFATIELYLGEQETILLRGWGQCILVFLRYKLKYFSPNDVKPKLLKTLFAVGITRLI